MIGHKLGHYHILEQLGTGGMGVVYRARDEKLQRSVALKLLPDQFTSQAEQRRRILAEARAAAALNHPGIITIYEVGEEGDQVFIVMELVSGTTLRTLASGTPMEPRALARLGAQVAEALAAAHECGVVHGDIKPENIVLQPDGRVKLLDFGIARQFMNETATTLTAADAGWQPPEGAGTPWYMAPEQLRGGKTDARADLFALGIVLYELAAGHRPFPGPTTSALAAQILNEEPPSLDREGGRIPPELARIVRKLLQKQPESRYQLAREVQIDLLNLARELELGPKLPPAVASKRALAVLPFKLLTPNAEDEYLGAALADALVNQLSTSGELLVRPTSTVMRYARQDVDHATVARETNVQVVVDGSIQKFGQKLRVHIQAWNAADGSTLYSAKHDAEMSDLFALQDTIGEALQRALGAKVATTAAAKEVVTPPTKNPMAYELFLRAADKLSRLNRWDTRTAIEMLENAVKLDPKFVDAWARLAEARVLMAVTFEPDPRWLTAAEQAVRRAVSLDPANAEAQCARGRVLWTPAKNFRHRAALQALATALRLNPGCHAARIWQCLVFLHVGLLEEAREGLITALATHPDDAFVLVFVGQNALYRWDYEEADEYQARAISVDPSHLWANVFYPTIPLYAGRLEEAEQKIAAARQVLGNDSWLATCEALLWAKRGESRKAEQMVGRALRGSKPLLHTHHMYHNAAAVYATLGKAAPAIALLEQAGSFGLPNYHLFRDDPHFTGLQGEPRFQKLLTKLKREWEGYAKEFGKPAGRAAGG